MDSLKLYCTIIEIIVKSRVHFHDMRCVMIARTVVDVLPGEMQAASKQRQFTRLLKNNRIQTGAIYKNLF